MVTTQCAVPGCDGAYPKPCTVTNADGPATETYCPRHAVMLGATPPPATATAALPVSNAIYHWLDGNEDIWNRSFPGAFTPALIADLLSGRARVAPRRIPVTGTSVPPAQTPISCASCGQLMTVIFTGQEYHPMCEPQP